MLNNDVPSAGENILDGFESGVFTVKMPVLVVSTSWVLTVAKNVNSSSPPCSLKVTLFDGQSLQRMQCGIFLRWKVNLVYLAFSRISG